MHRGRPPKNGNAASPFRTLAERGISKRDSALYQKLAAIPEADFEAMLLTGKSTGGMVREWFGAKRRRLASLERMAAELRAEGWTVFQPGMDRA